MIRGGNHRQTQAGGASSSAQQLNVNFIDCRFEGNRQRNPPAIFTYGVITVATHNHNINVRSCAFVENEYDTAEVSSGHSLFYYVAIKEHVIEGMVSTTSNDGITHGAACWIV